MEYTLGTDGVHFRDRWSAIQGPCRVFFLDRSVVDVGPHTTTDVDGAAGDASDAASGATNDV